tara:strand:+ start:807 stop:1061 length:255 start_codon:yes stop_codon:yes gene_type:complete
MSKINKIERMSYSGGLLGVIFGSSKGKLEGRIKEMNTSGWNVHFIHPESVNLVLVLFRVILLVCTLGLWTIGSSELLVLERDAE